MKIKQPICREICADPDLIMCEIKGGTDRKGTHLARREQIERIRDCGLRKTHACKWAEQIDDWIFKYLW